MMTFDPKSGKISAAAHATFLNQQIAGAAFPFHVSLSIAESRKFRAFPVSVKTPALFSGRNFSFRRFCCAAFRRAGRLYFYSCTY